MNWAQVLQHWPISHLRIVADGSALTVYRDGEEILSATDSSITDGRVALICDGNSDAYFDDILVTSLADPTTTTYEYNNANELTKETVGGSTVTNFYYDAWGRMTSKAQGSYSATYAYKYGDKLVSITSYSPGDGTTYVYYEYGGDGKRRERSSANPTSYIWYNWDAGFNVISEEDSGGGLQMTYVHGPVPGTVLAHINPSSGTYQYYFPDHLGSVRSVKNVDKSVYASYEYTPYGQVYDHSGSDVRHRFRGKEWDETAELYYFPFRYYSPGIARWMTRDPLRILGGTNLSWYCMANPVNWIDLLGLDTLFFDGVFLFHSDDEGCLLGFYVATSGVEGVTDQMKHWKGPILEGTWHFYAREVYNVKPHERKERDWGYHRVWLGPVNVPRLKESGRSGFYLHGGLWLGSGGCIDVGWQEWELFSSLNPGEVTLIVNYGPGGPPETFDIQQAILCD